MAKEHFRENIKVEIRHMNRPGPVKAYADVTYKFPDGTIRICGFGKRRKPTIRWLAEQTRQRPRKVFSGNRTRRTYRVAAPKDRS